MKRCVVITNGFYEWKEVGASKKPHFIRHVGDDLMFMAGLYRLAEGPDELSRFAKSLL